MHRRLSVSGYFALFMVIAIILLACFAPFLTSYDPLQIDLSQRFAPMSHSHWLGTDHLGRDIFARLLYGARISLLSSVLILGLILVLGIVVGGFSGLIGGSIDQGIMRLCDIFISFPTIILSLFLVGIFGAGLENVIIAIALTHWAWYARVIRSIVFGLKNKEYFLTSIVGGSSFIQCFKDNLWIPIFSQCIVLMTMDIGHMILHISALSFLGLGVRAPTPEWGVMLADSKEFLWSNPDLLIYPGVALFLTVASFNLLGDCLRDKFDTSIKRDQN